MDDYRRLVLAINTGQSSYEVVSMHVIVHAKQLTDGI